MSIVLKLGSPALWGRRFFVNPLLLSRIFNGFLFYGILVRIRIRE
jgi:hypothetical protein